ERIADGDRPLADAQVVGVAELGGRQRARGVDLEHGDVALGIASDKLGSELPLIGETHDDVLSVLDHVVVRQDVSLWIHQDTRAGGARVLARTPAEIALVELVPEELAESLRRLLTAAARALLLDRADVHDGRRDAVRDGAERVFHGAEDPARIGFRGRARLGGGRTRLSPPRGGEGHGKISATSRFIGGSASYSTGGGRAAPEGRVPARA